MTLDKKVEEIADVVFQSVMADIGKHYKVSDRLSDILSDSLSKHLLLALTQTHKDTLFEVIGELEVVRDTPCEKKDCSQGQCLNRKIRRETCQTLINLLSSRDTYWEEKIEDAEDVLMEQYKNALQNNEDGEANGYAHSLAIMKDLHREFIQEDNLK